MPRQESGCVVYVVDADPAVRHATIRLLVAAGLDAKPCDSIDALPRDRTTDGPACIVLDISGPGRETGRIKARLLGVVKHIPVIAVSAWDDARTRSVARDVGAQAFFRKPVDGAALVDSIAWATHAEGFGSPH
jgi:FixJ family two-component response regulator